MVAAERRGDDIEEISDGTYRYLGIEQVIGTPSRETKDKVVQEYLRRAQIVWWLVQGRLTAEVEALIVAHKTGQSRREHTR